MKAILTGATGYVGGLFSSHFSHRRWELLPPRSVEDRPWRLPDEVDASCFENASALIHCAWDMRPSSVGQAEATNVLGSIHLFEQASAAGVKNLIFISSMSAFAQSQSTYGRMKFAVEQRVLALGGIVVRPGLVYGKHSGGMVGKLLGLIKKLPIVPLPCANVRQYLIDEETLAAFVFSSATGDVASGVYSVAAATPQSMRDIVKALGRTIGRSVSVIPVPWTLAHFGLKAAQTCGLQLPVTTDNLLGLARSNPAPDFSAFNNLSIRPKTFPDGMIS